MARRLSAALLLRDEPIDPTEAEKILGFFSFIAGYLRAIARFDPGPGEGRPGSAHPDWASPVVDKYERCLTAARETGVAFKIDF